MQAIAPSLFSPPIASMPTRPTTRATLAAQQAALTLADPRWAAVQARDAAADGSFWYSVQSTGVYCRPSCASRTPRPENVRFHASCAEAERAGFRPCQRCKPQQPSATAHHAALVTQACRILEDENSVTLGTLAERLGLSSSHLHRIFKQATGLTPRSYAAAQREQRVRSALAQPGADSVTDAIYGAGYQSSSRFYEKSAQVLGMTPTRYRAGGAAQRIRFAVGQCSLGAILVAHSGQGLCAILLGDDPDALVRDLQDRWTTKRSTLAAVSAADPGLVEVVRERVLPGDMWRYFELIPEADDDWWRLLVDGVREFWPDGGLVRSVLPPVHRLVGWLVEHDRRADATAVVGYRRELTGPLPRMRSADGTTSITVPVLAPGSVPPEVLRLRPAED